MLDLNHVDTVDSIRVLNGATKLATLRSVVPYKRSSILRVTLLSATGLDT
jgi:hypothetical protein